MVICVTGIDTDVGKTVVTGQLAKRYQDEGKSVITVKLVQTGNVGESEDILVHRKMMGGKMFPEDMDHTTAPQIFKYPSSAKLAAELEGKTVNLEAIRSAVKKCDARYDVVLVETAGGLYVPLTEEKYMIDLIAEECWPCILVTNGRLGSLNHTLLSLEAMKHHGIKIQEVIYNWSKNVPPEIDADTPKEIQRWMRSNTINATFGTLTRV